LAFKQYPCDKKQIADAHNGLPFLRRKMEMLHEKLSDTGVFRAFLSLTSG